MRQLAALGGKDAKALADPFSEEQVRKAGEAMGPGVTYVTSTPIKTADRGRAARSHTRSRTSARSA